MIGTEIQNYRIIQMLGSGGMATVYKAQHKTLAGTFAAIKVLHPGLAQDAGIRAKFRKEAQLMSSFTHPNIGRVYDYAEDQGNLYLIMEYLEGPTLDELIRLQTGPIIEKRAIQIFSKILDGVGYAHRKGIIHRDLKPANIIITADDEPKIIDFGIVKMIQAEAHPGSTRTGQRIGTPMFMSPEQIIGRGVDHRSDIYALGVTLFQMMTGQLPYNPEVLSAFEIEQKVVNEALPKAQSVYPAVSASLQAVIDKATAKAKEDRFDDCEAFAAALQAAPSGVTTQILTPPARPVPEAPTPVQIQYFNAEPAQIVPGHAVTLHWNVTGVSTVSIQPLGIVAATGSQVLYPTADTTYVLQAGDRSATAGVQVQQRQKSFRIWPILLLLAVAGAVYFFLKSSNILGMETEQTNTKTTQTPRSRTEQPVTITVPQNSGPSQPTTTQPSGQVEVIPSPDEDELTENPVTPQEAQTIRNVLLRYITLSSSRGNGTEAMDVDGLLNMFAYPVHRYFNQKNVLPDAIEQEIDRYYNTVVYETDWEIDWDNLTYSRTSDGYYSVEIAGPYTFRGRKTDEVKTRMVGNRVLLNEDFKIISIYETK
ncbi:MAG: serine/threonine protein kinase [Sphingobacteriales bacterium]|nr:MAG: serine/threonine protein kinase [Sphingobacteriales bacterium]